MLNRLRKKEIEIHVFKGIGIDTYPVVDSNNRDLKAFCQSMKNKLNAVYCAKFIDSKIIPTWDMIDSVDYLKESKLLLLVNSIDIQNQEFLRERTNLFLLF